MATKLLTAATLKAVSEKDVGSILNDGGGLRGRVRRNRAGEITVQFEYKYRDGKKYRTAKVEQWPNKSLAVKTRNDTTSNPVAFRQRFLVVGLCMALTLILLPPLARLRFRR